MKRCEGSMRALWAVTASFLLLVTACDYLSGKRQRKWSEEVQLDDRTVITVDRYVAFEETDAFGGGAYSATETKSMLSFRGDLESLPKWDVPLVPVLLYHDSSTAEWVIVATTSRCEVWRARGGPLPPYWEYRLRDAEWREGPLSSASEGRETNLFFSYNPRLPSKHLDLRFKSDARADGRIAGDYLKIIPSMTDFCGNWPRPTRSPADKN
jgi:hypothetical protein